MAGLSLDQVNRKWVETSLMTATVKLKKGMEIPKSKKNALRPAKREKNKS